MSIRAILWAFDQNVKPSPKKFVLIALANFANDQGQSYPCVATISRITQQKELTVRKALKSMCEERTIVDTGKRAGPTQQVKIYQLPQEAVEVKIKPIPKGIPSPSNLPPNLSQKGEVNLSQKGEQSCILEPFEQRKALTDLWCSAFKERFGADYAFQGSRDGKAVTQLLTAGLGPIEAVDLARQAWAQSDQRTHWHCTNRSQCLNAFADSLNMIRVELGRKFEPNGHRRNLNPNDRFLL